ncbi:MAG TPA: hypothetical protein VM008_06490 [Phycisphaerae bacterium]|nr:hypothetical protein [Phycisphaerae bacterium]
MARYGRNKNSGWGAVSTWTILALIAGWGLWQLAQFRHTLLAQTATARTESVPQNTADSDTDPAATESASPSPAAPAPPIQVAQANATPDDDTVGDGSSAVGGSTPSVEIDSDPEANVLIARGIADLDDGRIIEGRTALNSALAILEDAPASDPRPARLRRQLTDLNEGIFLGSAILPEDAAARYIDIHYGDSFLKIGRRYSISADFLQTINPTLNPRNLKPASGVKIVEGPFRLRLVKHNHRLDLFARDWYVRSYPAQLEVGNYLPAGTYRIRSAGKIRVGDRVWIGFDGADSGTRDISLGWIYGDAGPRAGNPADDRSTGLKLADNDLAQVYNLVVENRSLLHVEP